MDREPQYLLRKAQELHLADRPDEAEQCYRHYLAAVPYDPAALQLLGFLLTQQGRSAEAAHCLEQACALDDRHAEWWFNFGVVLARLGRFVEARKAMQSAVALDANQYYFWTNLGAAEAELGQRDAAEMAWQKALALRPELPDAWFLLSAFYSAGGQYEAASRCNFRGILCEGPGRHPLMVLAQAHAELGQPMEAARMLQGWLASEPGHPVARHMLAACTGEDIPPRCDDDYVRLAFDQFAPFFDEKLRSLAYSGPALVQALAQEQGWPQAAWRIADLGCGTGLIGTVLLPHASRLVGVDLSAEMLQRARDKALYHVLYEQELAGWLAQVNDTFDLITCMDTFIYFGDLSAVLEGMHKALDDAGQVVFSTEWLAPTGPACRLQPSGRYAHTQAYVETLLAHAGFASWSCSDIIVRQESGVPLRGQLYCAQKRRRPGG